MRRRHLAAGVLASLIATAIVVPLAVAAPSTSDPITWHACPDGLALECATLTVPRDHRAPDGPTIEVAVSRLKAADPARRRGVLLLNPGGPSVPGLDLPLTIAATAPRELTDSYDLIGFDPRGVGRSTPVHCQLTPEQLDPTKLFPYPAPDGDIAASVAYSRQVAEQCGRHHGDLLPHITANTARDMDLIRTALGEQKISYLGVSYGSYLGAVYTTLFPERSDRIVLDSVFDPNKIWREGWRDWGPAPEERFDEFADWLAGRHAEYGLGATRRAVRDTYLGLAAQLDARPVPMPGNSFRAATRYGLYSDRAFDGTAKLWQAVKRGETPPGPGGKLPFGAPLWAIVCGDAGWPDNVALHQVQVHVDRLRHPITNGLPSNIWPCAFWPAKPAELVMKITDNGPSNVLLTQNLRDPATPHSGAVAMRAALGERARLVTVDQGGHGVYPHTGNACATVTATTFLVRGDLPKRDVWCPR